MLTGKIHCDFPFSIAMLVITRGLSKLDWPWLNLEDIDRERNWIRFSFYICELYWTKNGKCHSAFVQRIGVSGHCDFLAFLFWSFVRLTPYRAAFLPHLSWPVVEHRKTWAFGPPLVRCPYTGTRANVATLRSSLGLQLLLCAHGWFTIETARHSFRDRYQWT